MSYVHPGVLTIAIQVSAGTDKGWGHCLKKEKTSNTISYHKAVQYYQARYQNSVAHKSRQKTLLRLILLSLVVLILGGCAAVAGRPDPTLKWQDIEKSINGSLSVPDALENYTEAATNEEKIRIRNELMYKIIALIDIRYQRFVSTISRSKKISDSAFDISSIGLSGAAAVIDPGTTTSILSAIASGVTGSKASINKNFFFEKTVPAIVQSMEAKRRNVAVDLISGQQKSTEAYPISAAILDLGRYYAAGTLEGGLTAISERAAEQRIEDEAKIAGMRREAEREISELMTSYSNWISWLNAVDETSESASRLKLAVSMLAHHIAENSNSEDNKAIVVNALKGRIENEAIERGALKQLFDLTADQSEFDDDLLNYKDTLNLERLYTELRADTHTWARELTAALLATFGVRVPKS